MALSPGDQTSLARHEAAAVNLMQSRCVYSGVWVILSGRFSD